MQGRIRVKATCVALFAVVALVSGTASAQGGMGTVAVASGRLSGVFENGVTYYKGVPYAKPPVGNLRWAAPQDPAPWSGVRAADKYAPMAMQILSTDDLWGPEFYYDWFGKDPPMSEDCLYLNVVTPATTAGAHLPVLVFYHGGASMHGYSWEPEFEPSNLVKKGVVVVTVGYRLGVFGYLTTQALSEASPGRVSGNYGLLDQIKALEWVKKNIAAFGGDPDRVTLGGQSAGAGAVAAILQSPLAKGLFRGAILSWRDSFFQKRTTMAEAMPRSEAYLKEKGYGGMSVQQLRALPTSAFMSKTTPKSEVYGKGFGMNIDGYALAEQPVEYFMKRGAFNGINVIFGSNSGDRNDGFRFMTKDQVLAAVKRTYGSLADTYHYETLYRGVDDIGWTWEYFRLQNQQLATTNRVVAQVLQQLNPESRIYHEFFNRWPPGREAELRRSFHSSDLWYTFYSLRDVPQQRDWTPVDHEVADRYSSYWAHFVATGDPNGGTLPFWPRVSTETPVFLEIGDQFVLRTGFYAGTKQAARDDFMRDYAIGNLGLQKFFGAPKPGVR